MSGAASTLSAAADHTAYGLVSSSSPSAEQAYTVSLEAVDQIDSSVSQLSQQLAQQFARQLGSNQPSQGPVTGSSALAEHTHTVSLQAADHIDTLVPQLSQQPAGPTLVANAASRLSAAAEHTVHGLVASTSASAEQSYTVSSKAVNQIDSLVTQLNQQITQQLGSNQAVKGVQQLITRCVMPASI